MAEKMAARAFGIHPGKQQRYLLQHLAMAQHLRERGQFAWARREFEHVIAQAVDADNDELRVLAQSVFGEMLHDQGDDMPAAKTLEKLVEAIDAGKVTETELGGRRPSEVRSRMHYFFACHWMEKNEPAKHREYLDRALKADATDIDVLIACYRLPAQTPEYHAMIVDLIKKTAATNREQITDDPESPSAYNQFAWLIGNTEGDFDEALQYSKKSIELKPDEGGFYDTLARVYFAKGDLDNAIAQQTKAAEMEPHSGLIRRQLNFFRKKREEKKP
jgi:tetratricopeptide (TPR) repeat protein